MKISFKEVEDGIKNDIYVDGMLVGYVEINLWNQKWKIYPYFSFNPMEQNILYVEYSSFYKAGKALANLYSNTFMLSGYDEYEDNDTQPIDMRGVFSTRGRRKNP